MDPAHRQQLQEAAIGALWARRSLNTFAIWVLTWILVWLIRPG